MFEKFKKYKDAASIGIIGQVDEASLPALEELLGAPVRLVKKNGVTMLYIGKGLFKKKLVLENQK